MLNRSFKRSVQTVPWADVILVVLGILGWILLFSQYERIFPQAVLDLRLSRIQIAERARGLIAEYGYEVEDYEFALSFGYDSRSSIYLQSTLGIPETNRLISDQDLPIWYWIARWYKPLQQEEFALYLAPFGEVVGFVHKIPETDPGAALSQDQARQIAETYLQGDLGWKLEDWDLVVISSSDQPSGRVDHEFQWKRRDFRAGESELRLTVEVYGDRLGKYNYWLKTPESFWREFDKKYSVAGFINSLSYLIGVFGLGFGGLILTAGLILRGMRVFGQALIPALVVAVVGLLSSLNLLPLYKMNYNTSIQYSLFWTENIFGIIINAIGLFVIIAFLYLCGIGVNKIVWPGEDRILPRSADRWRILTRSVWRGLLLGGVGSAYVIIFYYVAVKILGGWIPINVPYSNLYATPFPFLYAIDLGLQAAMMEELLFRLIGIGFLLWLTRRRWLAVLVPGALWAFAHLSYVRDPIYMRGIELTIASLIYGYFFLKYGLITTIVAHASYNAMLIALPMLRSGETHFTLSGSIVVATLLTPLILGFIITARRRSRFPTQTPLISPAGPDDLPALSALPLQKMDWKIRMDSPNSAVICLRLGDRLIGVAVGEVHETEGRILAVYVVPEWRRQYWGSRLIQALSDCLCQMGATIIQADLPVSDRAGLSFLAGQGWKATRHTYTKSPLPTASQAWQGLRHILGKRDKDRTHVVP